MPHPAPADLRDRPRAARPAPTPEPNHGHLSAPHWLPAGDVGHRNEDPMPDALTNAERRLFDTHRIALETRHLRLADPDVESAVREAGAGNPVGFVHGRGMSAATWAPLLAHLPDRHAIALDLPGFGRRRTLAARPGGA